MMDRHICRAKCTDNGKWVYGYYLEFLDCSYIVLKDATPGASIYEFVRPIVFEVDFSTVCQYTGLHDKNNQPIFENDIILSQERSTRPYSKSKKSKRLKGVVYYDIGSGSRFYNKETQEWDKHMEWSAEWKVEFDYDDNVKYPYSSWGDFWDCEVVGNIFDNPELLEV